ncbi:MAG: acylphosphatase [Lachnospiraceae bacterium]|nr:acylphosphatase [Lachnospiraceae bacterium]
MGDINRIRKHYIFEGRVQGVGFRWTAKYAAESLGLTGWVANMYDGSVEMEIQGEESSLDRMLYELQKGRFIRITNIEEQKIPLEEHESGFSVKGY